MNFRVFGNLVKDCLQCLISLLEAKTKEKIIVRIYAKYHQIVMVSIVLT